MKSTGLRGGNDTEDKVYLASLQDAVNAEYGFQLEGSYDQARIGTATEYAGGQGFYVIGAEILWLRSPGCMEDFASYVDSYGRVSSDGRNGFEEYGGVRPALHIDLSSPSVQAAGKMETSLKSVSWDIVELGTYGGSPAVWRVLEVSGDTAFLLSDRILGKKEYNEERTDIAWKDSTLRAWLNGEFLNDTFTEAEKAGILSWTYENADNAWYGTEGGEDTQDKVTLLSMNDIVKCDYGFPSYYGCVHRTRIACGEEGLGVEGVGSTWWLRSPGCGTDSASGVSGTGNVIISGYYVDTAYGGVRPALHFSISSLSSLTYAGTVTVSEDGTVTYQKPGEGATAEESHTEAPTTEAPKTEAPTTETPNTEAAKTEVWTTEIPNMEALTTETPNTEAPKTETPATEAQESAQSPKNNPTKFNLANKKTCQLSKKVTIQDVDGLKSVKLNGKSVALKKGNKKLTFKLSKYKKYLKKKGKWNKLVIIDLKGKKTSIQFKIK